MLLTCRRDHCGGRLDADIDDDVYCLMCGRYDEEITKRYKSQLEVAKRKKYVKHPAR